MKKIFTEEEEKKLIKMINEDPKQFYQKTIETVLQMNLEYRIELYTLLNYVIAYMNKIESTKEEFEMQEKNVNQILRNHGIHSGDDLKKLFDECIDQRAAENLFNMPTPTEIQ